jgi:hypothetical protein
MPRSSIHCDGTARRYRQRALIWVRHAAVRMRIGLADQTSHDWKRSSCRAEFVLFAVPCVRALEPITPWESGSIPLVRRSSSASSPGRLLFDLHVQRTFAPAAAPRAGLIRHASQRRPPENRPALMNACGRRQSMVGLSTGRGGTSGEGSSRVRWRWERGAELTNAVARFRGLARS